MNHYEMCNDGKLFEQLAQNDHGAFAELFRRYDKRIYPFVLKMIRSESLAEEITQEIFIKLWVNRHKLSGIDRPDAYILTVANHHTLDHIKKQVNRGKVVRHISRQMADAISNITEETLLYREKRSLIERAAELLPEQQKKVFHLSRNEHYDYDEIARELNISRNTVRNHLSHALRSIKTYLDEHGEVSVASAFLLFSLLSNLI
jgi:RNA polymerase sigma-19 factor, ECF subfamily